MNDILSQIYPALSDWKIGYGEYCDEVETAISKLLNGESVSLRHCFNCGSPYMLEKHHIAGKSRSDVTVTLCRPCHETVTNFQRQRDLLLAGKDMMTVSLYGIVDILNLNRIRNHTLIIAIEKAILRAII